MLQEMTSIGHLVQRVYILIAFIHLLLFFSFGIFGEVFPSLLDFFSFKWEEEVKSMFMGNRFTSENAPDCSE